MSLPMNFTVWKLVIVIGLSAFAGSALTITINKISEPASVQCPVFYAPALGKEPLKRTPPINTGRDKEF